MDVTAPYAHLDIPMISQTYVFFRGTLAEPFTFAAGPESSEVQLFAPEDIPFDELAFSSVTMTLRQWVDDKAAGAYSLHHGVIRKEEGANPFDPNSYEYTDGFELAAGPVARA